MSPAESAGSTSTSRAEYASIDQTNSGIRIRVMPGVRIRQIVTRKLIAPISDAIERMWSDRIHRSWPVPGVFSDSGT